MAADDVTIKGVRGVTATPRLVYFNSQSNLYFILISRQAFAISAAPILKI
jgi:hypothetical protein